MEIEVPVSLSFRGATVRMFRADLVVETRVVLEMKTADSISTAHGARSACIICRLRRAKWIGDELRAKFEIQAS